MPNYLYLAKDKAGAETSGSIYAENETHLRDVLRSSEMFLTSCQIGGLNAEEQSQSLFSNRRVKLEDMVVFSRQLATLVRAGLPLVEAVGIVASQTENMKLAEVLRDVRTSVVGGESLSNSMRKHPRIFSDIYVSLVEAGEVGGVLDQTLEVAADQFDKQAVLRSLIKAALIYPALVVVACIFVVAFMLVFIVPSFGKVYKGFNAELPAVTKSLITLSNLAVHYGFWMLLAMGGIAYGIYKWYQTPTGREKIDRFLLKLPMFGKVIRKIAIARFAQTWAGATRGGIPILRALTVSANTCGNEIVRQAVMQVAMHVKEGSPLAPPLENTGEFPPMVTRMIAAGERSGNLDIMLDEINKFYERDVEYAVGKMTRLLEPVMTMVVGAIVLFVLVALYMPVFNLSRVIKR